MKRLTEGPCKGYKPRDCQIPPRPAPPEPKPIWEQIIELGESIPSEDWDNVPTDGSYNLHHYLYGAPKISINDDEKE